LERSDFFKFYFEGIGGDIDKYELYKIASEKEGHVMQIRNQQELDKAIKLAVDTSIGESMSLIKQLIDQS